MVTRAGLVLMGTLIAGIASAQGTIRPDRAAVTTRVVIGGSTFGTTSSLRLLGLATKSSETDCLWINASGDVAKGACPAGTVTSVSFTDNSGLFSVAGSPVTTSGGFTLTFANQSANTVLQRGTGTGVPSFSSSLTLGGALAVNGGVTLGDASDDPINFTGRVNTTMTWITDSNVDIGASGANRPRDLFLGRNALVGGTLGVTGTSTLAALSATTGTFSSTLGVTGTADLKGTISDSTGNLTVIDDVDLTGSLAASVNVGSTSYASQTTGWRATAAGEGDFRYLFTDELHAKSFIADLEQALAGGQIIAKSVAVVYSTFGCPAPSGRSALVVRDLPSAPGMAAFVANDWVALRSFTRAAGSLSISECVGVVSLDTTYVTAGFDSATKTQRWHFDRGSGGCEGGMSTGGTVAPDALVLDYGTTGNGYHEINAIDGAYAANSPYSQVVTWASCPVAANRNIRMRSGRLDGIFGNTNEFGFMAGVRGGAGFSDVTDDRFIRASNAGVELNNVDLTLYDGSTPTILLRGATSAPYFSVGTPAPTTYGGTGFWVGDDGGTYKLSIGDSTRALKWTGSAITVGNDSAEHLYLSGTALEFRNGATVLGSLDGSTWTLGSTSTEHLNLTSTALEFKNGSTVLGSLDGTTLTLGQPLTANNTGQMVIDSDSIDFNWRNNAGSTATVLQISNTSGSAFFSMTGAMAISGYLRVPSVTNAAGDLTVGSEAVLGDVILAATGATRPDADGTRSLGESGHRWQKFFLLPGTTTTAYNALVLGANGEVMERTNGITETIVPTSCATMTFHNGFLVAKTGC